MTKACLLGCAMPITGMDAFAETSPAGQNVAFIWIVDIGAGFCTVTGVPGSNRYHYIVYYARRAGVPGGQDDLERANTDYHLNYVDPLGALPTKTPVNRSMAIHMALVFRYAYQREIRFAFLPNRFQECLEPRKL